MERGIDEQLGEAGNQTVGGFVEGVEQKVADHVEGLRVVYGDAVSAIAEDAMRQAEGYSEFQLRIFDPDYEVKDTQAKGAAAWNDKSDNSIAVAEDAMLLNINEEYWTGVAAHEEVHQLDQAAVFNRSSISYPDDIIEVHPTLVEWHAITKSGQSDADLTPEYREHRRRGNALVAFLGSDAPLKRALKTGDMQTLQDEIDMCLIRESLKTAA